MVFSRIIILFFLCVLFINKFDFLIGSDTPHNNQDDSKLEVSQLISDLKFDNTLVSGIVERCFASEFLIRGVMSFIFYLSKLIKIFGDPSVEIIYSLIEDAEMSVESNAIISQSQFLIEEKRLNQLFLSLSSYTRSDILKKLEKAYGNGEKRLIKEINPLFEEILLIIEQCMLLVELFAMQTISKNLESIVDILITIIPEIISKSKESISKLRTADDRQFNRLLIENSNRPELTSKAMNYDAESIKEREISSKEFHKMGDYKKLLSGEEVNFGQRELELVSNYHKLFFDTDLTDEEVFFLESLFSGFISLAYFACLNAFLFNRQAKSECFTTMFQLNIEFQETTSKRGTNHLVCAEKRLEIRNEVNSLLKVEEFKAFDLSTTSITKSLDKKEVIDSYRKIYRLLLDNMQLFRSFEMKFTKVKFLNSFFHSTLSKVEHVTKLVLENLKKINDMSLESTSITAVLNIKKENSLEKLVRISQKVDNIKTVKAKEQEDSKRKSSKQKKESRYPIFTEERARLLKLDKTPENKESNKEANQKSKTSKSKSEKKKEQILKLQKEAEKSSVKEEIKHVLMSTRLENTTGGKRKQAKKNKNNKKKEEEKHQRELRMKEETDDKESEDENKNQNYSSLTLLAELRTEFEVSSNKEESLNLVAMINSIFDYIQENMKQMTPSHGCTSKTLGENSAVDGSTKSHSPSSKESNSLFDATRSSSKSEDKVPVILGNEASNVIETETSTAQEGHISRSKSRARSKSRSKSRARSKSRSKSRVRSRARTRSRTRSRKRSRTRSRSNIDSELDSRTSKTECTEGSSVLVEPFKSKFLKMFVKKPLEDSTPSVMKFFSVSYPNESTVTVMSQAKEIFNEVQNCFLETARLHNEVCKLLTGTDLILIKSVEEKYIEHCLYLLQLYAKKKSIQE
ncbi:unnamed protein product [Cryptosporidium hominis]|uniref:Uncharacterized protein (SKSR family) n=2 Tax=Cryptosporidium hominis TaxID=237895 RepID=A0A0S4TGK9_CRYHO|nr:Uncharacterized protein (SKSR family) [Cryptosporidium hominis]CUV05934.1 unnamed protein product [Cryptosporidium hominis]|eukprot:PPS92675.1 Uncharacterized protein (SKSR family) [Cryptosporidium hominis]